MADLLDPPARRPERDHFADAALVDHLLVELADAAARLAGLADEEDAVQAPVRDRAAARDCHDAGIPPALDDAGHAIPEQARLQLREFVRRIRARQHRQHAFERLPGQRFVRCGATDDLGEVIDSPAVHDRHGDDLLGQDVERVARQARRFDVARVHPLRDDRALEQVAPVLREDDAAARRPDLVAGPADRWRPRATLRRALDLDHEVHGAHVDPELERARGDDGRQPAGLQLLLDRDALLAGD